MVYAVTRKKMKVNKYCNALCRLIKFIHNQVVTISHRWTREELAVIAPEEITHYLKVNIYNNKDTDPNFKTLQ